MAEADPTPAPEIRTRPFADFLREHAGGTTHNELSEGIQDLVAAVTATHKGGSITLTINVKPMKENHDALVVTDKVVIKKPSLDRKASVFFADADSNLVRDDPRQLKFEGLTEIPGGARELDARERAAGNQ